MYQDKIQRKKTIFVMYIEVGIQNTKKNKKNWQVVC